VAPFLVATCWPLTSLAAKCKIVGNALLLMLLALEIKEKIAHDKRPKLCHQSSVVSYTGDNQ